MFYLKIGSNIEDCKQDLQMFKYILRQVCDFAYRHGLACFSTSVSVCMYVTSVRKGRDLVKMKNVKNDVCRFWYLTSNGIIAKILLGDLDLHFEVQKLKTFVSLKRWELAKMHASTLVDFYICHRMALLLKLYSVTFTYFLRFTNLKHSYFWNGES